MYLYIFGSSRIGWSHEIPTREDRRAIDANLLTVLKIEAPTQPKYLYGRNVRECKVGTSAEGKRYHYV